MKKILWYLPKTKKILLAFFLLGFFFSLIGLLRNFYAESTVAYSGEGGRLTEGAVGQVDQNFLLNPLLIRGTNKATSVEADIVRLVFAGLMKFDSETGEILDNLADHTLSADKRVYTFTLKEGLIWHDNTPLTADDVIFTYRTLMQHPEFPNAFLQQAFTGVVIEKEDERTVTFTLPTPYKFFLTNFTIGLLPKHLLEELPVANIQFSEFNQNPIGAGPYRFSGVTLDEVSPISTISLEAFPEYIAGKPKISQIDFELFPTEEQLLRNVSKFDAMHPQLQEEYTFLKDDNTFQLMDFTIPQYIAVFLNTQQPIFSGEGNMKMRLALQLSTNKEELLSIVPGKRIDTPLLETDTSEWLFEFDPEKAAGALKDSGWYLPGTVPVEAPPEPEENSDGEEEPEVPPANQPLQYITEPTTMSRYWTTARDFYLLGNVPEGTTSVQVNGYQLQLFSPAKGTFSYRADTTIGTLLEGENVYTVAFFNGQGGEIAREQVTIFVVNDESEIPSPEPVEEISADESGEEPDEEVPGEPEPDEDQAQVVEESDGIRENVNGEKLTLNLVTVETPAFYQELATELVAQWEEVGIATNLTILPVEEFVEKAIINKEYDLLLYGQSLGYNLDAFPYWHSSQAETGLNLSRYRSFEADVLLEEIRQTHDEEVRETKLSELRDIIKNDAPAVFLLSPLYTVPMNAKIKNIQNEYISLAPDRFSNVESWYIRESREFSEGKSWFGFVPWFFSELFDLFSFS